MSARLLVFSSCFEGVVVVEEWGDHRGPQHINMQLFRVSHAYVTPALKTLFSSLTTCSKLSKTFYPPVLNCQWSVFSLLFCVQWTGTLPHSVKQQVQYLIWTWNSIFSYIYCLNWYIYWIVTNLFFITKHFHSHPMISSLLVDSWFWLCSSMLSLTALIHSFGVFTASSVFSSHRQ